jgi:hypothetical protein
MASPQLADGAGSVVPLDEVPGSLSVVSAPVEPPLLELVDVVSNDAPVEVELVALVVGRPVVGGSVPVLVGEPLAVSRSTGPPPASLLE